MKKKIMSPVFLPPPIDREIEHDDMTVPRDESCWKRFPHMYELVTSLLFFSEG